MTAIGTFRHVVTLERPGPPALDAAGGYTEQWTPLTPATWHCSIQTARASDLERIASGVITATAALLLRGRFHAELLRAGAAARVRFVDRTGMARTFTIASVHDRQERGIELEVIAREVTGLETAPPTPPPTGR
jgi:head-tail adaptor